MQYLKAAVGASGSVSPVFGQPSQWNRLNRFLILGNDTATYYAGVRKLFPENAGVVRRCLADDGPQTVRAITDMRTSGRAPRSDAALLALAMAASPAHAGPGTNAAALDALPAVARSASELRKFAGFVTAGRGWGRSLRSAIARWYMEKPARQLAMQMIKERRRGRWSHADLLRMSHPKPETRAHAVLFRWVVDGGALCRAPADLLEGELKPLHGFELARKATDRHAIVALIEDYQLTPETIPEQWLGTPDVWEALLESMPYCALLRNLGKLTAVGLITPQGETTALVAARLVDHRRIERAKVHPVTLLEKLLDYKQRHQVPAIAAALEAAYYTSFANVPPAPRSVGLKLDPAALIPSTAMAMLAGRKEPGSGASPARLDAVMEAVRATAAAEPPSGAEAIVVVTADREWRPFDRPAGVPLVVIAPHARGPVVAGAGHPWLLQVCGFDATVPPVVADFIANPI